MKILSDFDGVLTEQTEEALRVRAIFADLFERFSGRSRAETRGWIESADAEVMKRPQAHGWWDQGRISAFADEDLFVRGIAVAACLDQGCDGQWCDGQGGLSDGGPAAAREDLVRGARREGLPVATFADLAQLSYMRMTEETRKGELKPMEPESAPLIRRWLDEGHDVVIVSNSGTDRILQLLAREGLDAADHARDPKARLRVRGGARKFSLSSGSPDPAQRLHYPPFVIETDRPTYEEILTQERPSRVIGDVFSLDLALPLRLARARAGFEDLRLYLRRRAYTPGWAVAAARELAGPRLAVIDRLEEI